MDEVIERTLDKGVFMITVGTQKDTSRKGLEVAERYEGVWAAIGLHPNHTVEQSFWDDDELAPEDQATPKIKTRAELFDYELFKEMAAHPKCVAIGETGLDWYRIPDDANLEQIKDRQREAARAHFDLATEMDLPVIIHSRDAYEEQVGIIREYVDAGKLPRRGVMHCFTGTLEEAQAYIDLGFYISFSGIVTFSKELQEVARAVPMDRILVETDSPYLTPNPHRGKRNEPHYVLHVAEKIAGLRGVSVEEVADATVKNTKNLFKLNT